jgi:hypothetical protein
VPDAILAAYADLWNPEQTRLTVFFDPGRVKRGVGPNLALGRAIVEGRQYAIAVDAEWPDASGQPLVASFRQAFMAGPPAYDALDQRDWAVAPPRAGGVDPLRVTFPAPLDRALLDRAVGVRSAGGREVPGRIDVGAGETTWTFTPEAPWSAGTYQLVALTLLEDPAGNQIGRPFERLSTVGPEPTEESDVVQIPFTVR